MPRTRLAVVVLAAGAVAMQGCGATTKSPTQPSSVAMTAANSHGSAARPGEGNALARGVLIARADAICARVRNRLQSNKFHTQAQISRLGPKIAAYERAAAAELRKLVPPSALASDFEQIVKGTETLASDAALIGKYAKLHQLETIAGRAIVAQSGKHGVVESEIARRDGFVTCAIML